MSEVRRIFMDLSYTRTQAGNVGITRTVRRLLDALAKVPGIECIPVAFHSGGFRSAGSTAAARPTGSPQGAARVYRRLTSGVARRLISACVPLPVLETAWALAGRWTFDSLSVREPAVAFRPGDWLVLADESWNYRAWTAAERARAQGARVLLVVYDLIPLRQPQYCAPLFARVFPHWLARMLASCDAVLCISRATQGDLLAWCAEQRIACPPAANFRLGSDVPVAGSGGVRESVREFLGAPGVCFAAVGTIEPRKNHALMLDVFERLWAAGEDLRLFIAGRAHADCQALVERMRQHPQRGRRLLTVHDASDAEIALAYTQCRALVFASLAEGFGLPLVEARARGCAVIASDLPALLELADEGVSFFASGNADALEEQLRLHAAAARPHPAAGRAFTWDDSASQFIARASGLLEPAASGVSP